MAKPIRNLPASVHDRLLHLSHTQGRPFQELLYRYALERFIFRLSHSPYAQDFVLKGGLTFYAWNLDFRRTTRDIDVQAFLQSSEDGLAQIVRELCALDGPEDGLAFDPASVQTSQIQVEADYPGIRIAFTGRLGSAQIYLHMDVSFGNVISPHPVPLHFPTLLEPGSFQITGYPVETAVAEKVECILRFGGYNDRIKDYYELWLISKSVCLTGQQLVAALRATVNHRRTRIETGIPVGLSIAFAQQKQSAWRSFLRRNGLDQNQPGILAESFEVILMDLQIFLLPVISAVRENTDLTEQWSPVRRWH